MRLDNFIAFLEVARYHSMKIASDHLYTTPQDVSKLVRELELRFGKKLFTRGKKQMNLTKDGEIAFKAIEEIIEKWDSLECEMKKDNIEKYTGVTKSMKIIVSYAAAESLRNIFRTMLLESNSPLIEIIETDINTIITKTPFMEDVDYIFFEQIDSDATINSRKNFSEHYEVYILKKERLSVYLNRNSKYSTKRNISLAQLKELPLAGFPYDMQKKGNTYDEIQNEMNINFKTILSSTRIEDWIGYLKSNRLAVLSTSSIMEDVQKILGEELISIPLKESLWADLIMCKQKNFSATKKQKIVSDFEPLEQLLNKEYAKTIEQVY